MHMSRTCVCVCVCVSMSVCVCVYSMIICYFVNFIGEGEADPDRGPKQLTVAVIKG